MLRDVKNTTAIKHSKNTEDQLYWDKVADRTKNNLINFISMGLEHSICHFKIIKADDLARDNKPTTSGVQSSILETD